MKFFPLLSTLFTLTLLFISCKENQKTDKRIETWYLKIKDEIMANAKRKEDSIFYENKGETLFITYFLKGKKIRQEYRSADTSTIHVTKQYGENELFELRSEIHKNGQKRTEGITFQENYYGPWTVWYENGEIMQRGYRYEKQDFGDWIYYTDKGKVKKEIDNNKMFLADSILQKESLHTASAL